MLRTISTSNLRAQIKRVLNDVGYGNAQYIVEKFGEPTAAIISMEDFRLLQATKQQQATASLKEMVADIRNRARQIDAGELEGLIEEARTDGDPGRFAVPGGGDPWPAPPAGGNPRPQG